MTNHDDELGAAFHARGRGVEAVLAADVAVHRGYRDRIEVALAELCRRGEPFTALDVDRLTLEADPNPYPGLVLASVMSTWARRGDIVLDTTRYPIASTRRSRHGARLLWWRYGAADTAAA